MQADTSAFRHRYPMRVRSFHADRQNVVHNIWYFYYFEEARVEFMRECGFPMGADTFVSDYRFYVAHNSCDYLAPAVFDEELEIFTRTARIGESSIAFEHLAVRVSDGAAVAKGTHVLVHVDTATDRPATLPDALRTLLSTYEDA